MDGNGMYIDKTIPENAGGAYAPLGRIDKFELLRELGEGGFGAVYLARDTVAGIDVAIKGLPPEVKHNRAEIENIRENFALVKRLRHPNIVAVTDLHCAQDVFYAGKDVEDRLRVYERDTMVVMDYAPGVTLSNWRKRFPGKTVPPGAALEIVRQIAAALDYAHGRKVLHRDIKPANIMVETADDGTVTARVLDFGLAAEIRSSMGRVSREIRDTSGSRPYMAPEQWGGRKQGPATDQYALAVLLYELVTGEVPFASVFDCGDAKVMRLAVMEDAPEIPSGLPKTMRKALAVALSKKPEERFATCGDFVAALEGKRSSRRGAETQRNGGVGKVLGLLALLAVLAAFAGVGWLYHQNQERRRASDARVAKEIRKAENVRKAEESRKAEQARKAEAKNERKATENRKADEARLEADRRRSADEAQCKRLEEEKLTRERELARQKEEGFRKAAEAEKNDGKMPPGKLKSLRLPGGAEMRFHWCPPGSFSMGSGDDAHDVTLTKGFWMGETEVTEKQWRSVMSNNLDKYEDDDYPVQYKTWYDCQDFIKKINASLGCSVRLPTEAEWEYACRAGKAGPYGGTGRLDEMGWYSDNSEKKRHPVGQKSPNDWGLYDMHGNMLEWCSDWYARYEKKKLIDPFGPDSGHRGKVLRGGSFISGKYFCTVACREGGSPRQNMAGVTYVGFRLCFSESAK